MAPGHAPRALIRQFAYGQPGSRIDLAGAIGRYRPGSPAGFEHD